MHRNFSPDKRQQKYDRRVHTGSPPEPKPFIVFTPIDTLQLKPDSPVSIFTIHLDRVYGAKQLEEKFNEHIESYVAGPIKFFGRNSYLVVLPSKKKWKTIMPLIYEAMSDADEH